MNYTDAGEVTEGSQLDYKNLAKWCFKEPPQVLTEDKHRKDPSSRVPSPPNAAWLSH